MAYPYYPNNQIYMQNMQDLQNMREKIDRQMQQMQQLNQNQMQQQPVPQPQPQIHQSFQLAPQSSFSEIQAKYVSDINDVKNTFVMSLGMFLNKEMTTLWLKNINGEIRTFSLNEIIEQDPKDIEINNLKKELQRMREMINYGNESDVNNSDNDGADESKNAKKLSNRTKSNAK